MTTRIPTWIADELLDLLTASETKILVHLFVISPPRGTGRHEFIGLSAHDLANGLTRSNGRRISGCGLSAATVATCLANLIRYRVLSSDGHRMAVAASMADVDALALHKRLASKRTVNVQRTVKAQSIRAISPRPTSGGETTRLRMRRQHERTRATSYAKLAQRDGERCAVCGSTDALTVDHIVPIARDGTNELSNLQLLCFGCNVKKGAA